MTLAEGTEAGRTELRLPCFMAYDIRGRVPSELNEDLAWRIGRSYARVMRPEGPVAVGHDVRVTSPALAAAVIRGLNDEGVPTRTLGLCGTETVYFAAALPGMGGGIMVTASHNPIEYNGMKLVRGQARPISGDTGLFVLEEQVRQGRFGAPSASRGENRPADVTAGYVERVLGFVKPEALRPLHLVVNAGNGCAGPTFDALAARLPFRVTRVHHEPDGRFPHGIPNPLLPENRAATAEAVVRHGADMGIAWDGDFDRCFVFDERGRFIEGYYIVGLLAAQMLHHAPGARIIYDPRLTWNTVEMVEAAGGVPVMSKTGHAFIKERMRAEDALYGGEMSAHHYFRDFAYCDSGMIPWLLLAAHMSETGKPLSALVDERMQAYPCSGEINFRVPDPQRSIQAVLAAYAGQSPVIDRTDGISLEFASWRFNLRTSNTEPVLRLNVEARGDVEEMQRRTAELRRLITTPS
jgi:phosphomannomutase